MDTNVAVPYFWYGRSPLWDVMKSTPGQRSVCPLCAHRSGSSWGSRAALHIGPHIYDPYETLICSGESILDVPRKYVDFEERWEYLNRTAGIIPHVIIHKPRCVGRTSYYQIIGETLHEAFYPITYKVEARKRGCEDLLAQWFTHYFLKDDRDWLAEYQNEPVHADEDNTWDSSRYATYGDLSPWEPIDSPTLGQIRYRYPYPFVVEKPRFYATLYGPRDDERDPEEREVPQKEESDPGEGREDER